MRNKKASVAARAAAIAVLTQDAYSAGQFSSWAAVAKLLLKMGFDEREAEAIMRSKWTRWARDAYQGRSIRGKFPARAVGAYLLNRKNFKTSNALRAQVAQLVRETFAEGAA